MSKKLIYSLALATALPAIHGGCTSPTTARGTGARTSWTDKVGDSVKSGAAKVAGLASPQKPSSGSMPPNGKPGPEVYVALAQMSERTGNFEEAATQYQKALTLDANHLGALLAYAHLEDRQSNFEAATKHYQKALKKHSKDAMVHNDLGLCYHRRAMLPEATKSLQTAVELQPQRKLYRDNLAAVYVEQGKTTEALEQLVKAHGEAVGNYNLGFLLTQRHNDAVALVHFRKAAEKDPSLEAAHQWIARLSTNVAAVPQTTGPALADATMPSNTQTATNATYVASQGPDANSQATAGSVGRGTLLQTQAVQPQYETRGVQYPQRGQYETVKAGMPPLPDAR